MLSKSVGLLSLTVLTASLAVPAAAGDITVVGWGGNWDKAYKKGVWGPYMAEKGDTIVMENWGGEVAKIRAQVQAGNVTYDIVSIEAPALEIGCAEGLFMPLTGGNGSGRYLSAGHVA